MSTCVKTIRFSAICSALFAILTYTVSVNVEGGFFRLSSIWISNNFILTISGGIFTGFFVMLLCEIQKYFENKRKAEDGMFAHIAFLYFQLYAAYRNIQDFLADKSAIIPENFLFCNMGSIEQEIGLIPMIDYAPFSRKNALFSSHKEFCQWISEDLRSFTNSKYYLAIAVKQDRITNIQEGKQTDAVTSASPVTNRVLSILEKEIPPLLKKVDCQLEEIEKYCGGRYSWQVQKQAVEKSWKGILQNTFGIFLEKGSEHL